MAHQKNDYNLKVISTVAQKKSQSKVKNAGVSTSKNKIVHACLMQLYNISCVVSLQN